MGLNTTERKQLVNILHNYVERAYANDQSYREFSDHLIELYEKAGLSGFSGSLDRDAFLELVEKAL